MNYFLAALQKYAVFSGRARRSEYWYFQLIPSVIILVLGVIDKALGFEIGGVEVPDGNGGNLGSVRISSLLMLLVLLSGQTH